VRSDVYSEDIAFADVLFNRIPNWGGSVSAVVGLHGGQYNTAKGVQTLTQALFSDTGSSLCKDFRDSLAAFDYVLNNGSTLPSAYQYWKAIDQGPIGFHQWRPGDIYIANTAFGVVN